MDTSGIAVLGLSHHTAPVSLREQVSLAEPEIQQSLRAIANSTVIQECVIVSTCNRTEVYAVSTDSDAAISELKQFFVSHKKLSPTALNYFYTYTGSDCVCHLFRVASGLESQVMGEPQILGQLKDAFRAGLDSQTTGVFLNRLFNLAFEAAKQVRTDTSISRGAVSIAFAAVKMAEKIFRDLHSRKILLIGSGKTGTLVARHLQKRAVKQFFVANRTLEHAEALAGELDGSAHSLGEIEVLLPQMDLVIGASGSPGTLLDRSIVSRVMQRRKTSDPLFLIDIAMPRDFAADINSLGNVFLSDLDALNQIIAENMVRREEDIECAVQIIAERVSEYQRWKQALTLKPTIISLRKKLEQIRTSELAKLEQVSTPNEYEMADKLTRGLINKILHIPMSQLKRYRTSDFDPDTALRIDVLREIFDLEGEVNE